MSLTKKLFAASAVVAMLAVAGSANAAITASSSGLETYSTDVTAFPSNIVCTFDVACTGGFAITPTGGAVVQTGNTPLGAAPPSDTTAYMSVVGGGTATLTAPIGNVFSTLSFYMGSPDLYNSLSFFLGATQVGAPITGANFGGAVTNGDQTFGERISIAFNGAQVDRVQFNSTSTAFEFDRVAATVTAVPEVATWGMMIMGLGMVGMGLRMRRRTAGAVA